MTRTAAAAVALVCLGAGVLAASEEDRRNCAANQSVDDRIAACTRLLADQGTSPALRTMAYRNRGISYANKNLHELAIMDHEEALKLSPQDQGALFGRARALYLSGQYDRAIAGFTEHLRLNPRNERTLHDRALAYSRKGDLDLALADYQEAIKINPSLSYVRNNHALVLVRQGKFDLAIAEYSEAIRLDPSNLLAHSNRGRAYEETGQYDQALADYKVVGEKPAKPNSDDDRRAKASAAQRMTRLTALIAEGKTTPRAIAIAERRVALFVGNSAYAHVPALRNPANDAKSLAAALRALNFEVREVYDANLSEFGKALKDFGDLAAGADWALIYYAGHGIEIGGTNYLIPVDAKLELQRHVEDEAVPLTRMVSKVTGASKLQLVILDACRNNPFISKMRTSGGRATRSVGQGLASIEPESGVLVAYAARDGTTALDGDASHSPYAEALIKYIAEPNLEISLLFRKVRDEVVVKTGRQQEPYIYGSLSAQQFYFRR